MNLRMIETGDGLYVGLELRGTRSEVSAQLKDVAWLICKPPAPLNFSELAVAQTAQAVEEPKPCVSDSDWVTADELADMWGVSLQEVYSLARRDRWPVEPPLQEGGGIRYRRIDANKSIGFWQLQRNGELKAKLLAHLAEPEESDQKAITRESDQGERKRSESDQSDHQKAIKAISLGGGE